jgi:hypothetical protein
VDIFVGVLFLLDISPQANYTVWGLRLICEVSANFCG